MGIKGLFSFIKHTGKIITLNKLNGLRIGVDISYFIYKWGTESPNKYFEFVSELEALGNKVIFIFDGIPSKYKEPEIQTRKQVAAKAASYADSLESSLSEQLNLSSEQTAIITHTIQRERKKGMRPTKEERQSLKRCFYERKINMLKSAEEADELLVALMKNGDIDTIISGDTDLLRLGAERILVPTDESGSNFIELEHSKVLKRLNLNSQQFQEMCILTGGVQQIEVKRRVDIRKAWTWIRIFGSIEGIIENHKDYWPCHWPSVREAIENLRMPDNVEDWIRKDDMILLEAWRKDLPMPYMY